MCRALKDASQQQTNNNNKPVEEVLYISYCTGNWIVFIHIDIPPTRSILSPEIIVNQVETTTTEFTHTPIQTTSHSAIFMEYFKRIDDFLSYSIPYRKQSVTRIQQQINISFCYIFFPSAIFYNFIYSYARLSDITTSNSERIAMSSVIPFIQIKIDLKSKSNRLNDIDDRKSHVPFAIAVFRFRIKKKIHFQLHFINIHHMCLHVYTQTGHAAVHQMNA